MGTRVRIDDWFALEMAFGYTGADRDSYLDLRTGGVRILPKDESADDRASSDLLREPGRFVHIDPVPPSEQYRWLVKFAASVEDGKLRTRLERALTAAGAFRNFNDVLRPQTEEWNRWRLARMALVREYLVAWLAEHGLELDEPPPWRRSGTAATQGQLEDERLRRVAHEHLDRLSDAGVDLAIGYLRHVHRRWNIQ